MRTRIATDLHDDIGANLTRIAILSEVVRRKGPAGSDDHLRVDRHGRARISDPPWATSLGDQPGP